MVQTIFSFLQEIIIRCGSRGDYMNRRQKKKWNKNHITWTNRFTGKKETIKVEDFIVLAKIAGLTREDLEYMCRP